MYIWHRIIVSCILDPLTLNIWRIFLTFQRLEMLVKTLLTTALTVPYMQRGSSVRQDIGTTSSWLKIVKRAANSAQMVCICICLKWVLLFPILTSLGMICLFNTYENILEILNLWGIESAVTWLTTGKHSMDHEFWRASKLNKYHHISLQSKKRCKIPHIVDLYQSIKMHQIMKMVFNSSNPSVLG